MIYIFSIHQKPTYFSTKFVFKKMGKCFRTPYFFSSILVLMDR